MNNIEQYTNSKGEGLIFLYIQKLLSNGRSDHAKKILKTLERLENNDLSILLKIKLVKKINGWENIFELIINWKNANYRIFFSIIKNTFYLTNIFYKKTQKTSVREIDLADKRRKIINQIYN
jgi:phage-related protein